MQRKEVIYLLQDPLEETQNDTGDIVDSVPSERKIFATKLSIRQSEFYQAQANGLKPELMFEIYTFEYNNEPRLKFKDKVYSIDRVYEKDEKKTELICTGLVNQNASS